MPFLRPAELNDLRQRASINAKAPGLPCKLSESLARVMEPERFETVTRAFPGLLLEGDEFADTVADLAEYCLAFSVPPFDLDNE